MLGVEELTKIDSFWKNHAVEEDDEDHRMWFTNDDDEYHEVYDILWDNLFIGSGWNYDNKDIMEANGYRCWIGDDDSFGILVAVITKDDKNFSLG